MPAPSLGKQANAMSRTPITRVGAAAIGLLSLPATAVTSYQIVVADPNAAAIIATSATPFARGSAYGGSSAGSTLVTSHAQTAASDGFASGYAASSAVVRSTLDLTGITAHRVTFRYALQVGGIDATYGSALVLSDWVLGYTNGAGHLVALVGERAIDTSGVATQCVYRYDGSGNPGVQISNRYYGRFTCDVAIDPFATPAPTIFAQSECDVSEAVASGGYCSVVFGFGIAPRPVIKPACASLSSIAGVPEPASWALMVAGFGVIGAAARRRTRTFAA